MQETDLREIYISYFTKRGISRKIAEETVDITDDDGNVIGLIDEEALQFELCLRDIFRSPDVREDLERHLSASFPSISGVHKAEN